MTGEPPPSFTDDEVIAALRAAAAARRIGTSPQGQNDLLKYDYDLEGVCQLLSECTVHEIDKHELDYEYPERNDYTVVLNVELDEEPPHPFYVKVALHLPEMTRGKLLSFKYWT